MKGIVRNSVLITVFLTVAFNITYWAIAKYNVMEDLKAASDASKYIQMSRGDYDNVQTRYLRRWLVPSIVDELNRALNVRGVLDRYYEIEDYKLTNLNFGIVNIFFLTFTAFLFFYFCRDLGFSEWESLTAGLLFLTSFFVVTYYTVPLVDSGSAFFIMAGFWAIRRKKMFWLSVIFLIGVFVKETTFVLVFALFLADWKAALKNFYVFLPGVVLYAVLSSMVPNIGFTLIENVTNSRAFKASIVSAWREINLYALIEDFQVLMFLWVLFFYAVVRKWAEIPEFLRRQMGLIVLIVVVPFLHNSGAVGRAAFYLFPVLIPPVLLVLRDAFEGAPENYPPRKSV